MNTIIQKIFPNGIVKNQGGSRFEVNGLSKNTMPQGEIVAQGPTRFTASGRRDWFLVKQDDHLVLMRICAAYPDSGYDEFVVIHEMCECSNEEQVAELHAFFNRQTQK